MCPGVDPPEGDVALVYWSSDWSAVPEHRQRCQQSVQQHWIPLLLHALLMFGALMPTVLTCKDFCCASVLQFYMQLIKKNLSI